MMIKYLINPGVRINWLNVFPDSINKRELIRDIVITSKLILFMNIINISGAKHINWFLKNELAKKINDVIEK